MVENLGETEYRIDVTPDGARLSAGSEDALRHAETTYEQLLDAAVPAEDGKVAVPAVRIADAPRFAWRGVMLDVARHFMPKDDVLRFVDLLAAAQAQRAAPAPHRRPGLAGRDRARTRGSPRSAPGGRERWSAIAPRRPWYDGRRTAASTPRTTCARSSRTRPSGTSPWSPRSTCPATSQAAIAAYPELGNPARPSSGSGRSGGSARTSSTSTTRRSRSSGPCCDEVLELFPSPYVHVGGDECPTDQWTQAAAAQERQARARAADEAGQLQAWFTAQVASMLTEARPPAGRLGRDASRPTARRTRSSWPGAAPSAVRSPRRPATRS